MESVCPPLSVPSCRYGADDGGIVGSLRGSTVSTATGRYDLRDAVLVGRSTGTEQGVDVAVTVFGFRLPGHDAPVTPVLRADGEIVRRALILLFDLPEDPDLTLDDDSLTWSEAHRCFYRYAPPTPGAGIVRTAPLTVPSAARTLRLRLRPRPADAPTHVLDCCLETDLDGAPSLILATEA